MHEISAARNLVELIEREIPRNDLSSVRTVNIRIGDLAGLVPGSLEFCFGVIIEGTPLAASHLSIEPTPFTIYCENCGRTSENSEGILVCPLCSNPASSIVAGNELQLLSVEVEDAKQEQPCPPLR